MLPGSNNRRELFESMPRIDLVLIGPKESIHQSWNLREGWVTALQQLGCLNDVFWTVNDECVIEKLFKKIEISVADFVLIMNCDHHQFYLHNTPRKKDFWRQLPLPSLCFSTEKVLNSPFPRSQELTESAINTFDAFIYIDELSNSLFESSGKPSLWVPQFCDGTLFENLPELKNRNPLVLFKGKITNFGIPGVYDRRLKLVSSLFARCVRSKVCCVSLGI